VTPPTPMPAPVAEVFRPLHNELLDIHVKWSQFRQLFGTDADRIALLNRFAPVFFGYADRIMYDDFVLALFRFTDRVATCGHPNLCLEQLAEVLTNHDPAFGHSIQADAEAIDVLLEPHANWRDRRAAHNDLGARQARWAGTSTLTGPSREKVEEILEHMRRLMNRVATHYGEVPTAYEAMMLPCSGDADTLVRRLEEIVRWRDSGPRSW
jgi:hypothetical protein